MDISNPKSKNYGIWLSKEQSESFTGPSRSSFDTVSWLLDDRYTPTRLDPNRCSRQQSRGYAQCDIFLVIECLRKCRPSNYRVRTSIATSRTHRHDPANDLLPSNSRQRTTPIRLY